MVSEIQSRKEMFHLKGKSFCFRDKQGKSSYACFHASRNPRNDEGNHRRSDEKYEYVSLLILICVTNKERNSIYYYQI